MPTMKKMCETIVEADFLRKEDGSVPTAEEIFSSSKTGELFQIVEWYKTAKLLLASKDMMGPVAEA